MSANTLQNTAIQVADAVIDNLEMKAFKEMNKDGYKGYCALAACFEWQGYIEQGEGFVSHLPIALDGSCSGLQHFSAMLRDPIGGAAVNLTRSEKPQDVYTQVAKKAQEMADASAEEYARKWPQLVGKKSRVGEDEVDLDGLRHAWANNLVSRTIAKRPTMTYCYSATRFGMQKMILQTLNELDKEREKKGQEPYLGGVENYHAASWLSYAMWEAISEVVVAASTAMEWLRDVAKVAADGDLPIWWTSPIGLPILQEYKTVTGTRVKAHWAGQRVDLVINAETDGLDKRAQSNGIAPNFVHSLDASHLMAVALRAKEKGIRSLAVIHDSFGTHAANTDHRPDDRHAARGNVPGAAPLLDQVEEAAPGAPVASDHRPETRARRTGAGWQVVPLAKRRHDAMGDVE